MSMSDRGVIQYPARKQQINDFSKLLVGKITPTDIDGLIEYKNKAYIFLEVKYKNVKLPDGQKLALERLCDDLFKVQKLAVLLVVEHNVDDTKESVNVGECFVRECYFNKKWTEPNKLTVVSAITQLIKMSEEIFA
jgi:hypothetical protein